MSLKKLFFNESDSHLDLPDIFEILFLDITEFLLYSTSSRNMNLSTVSIKSKYPSQGI